MKGRQQHEGSARLQRGAVRDRRAAAVDTLRQAWDGGAWQACFERAASDLLNEHGLLGTDLSGPCAGVPKTVVHVAALRSLPGCGEQPRHADFARQLAYR